MNDFVDILDYPIATDAPDPWTMVVRVDAVPYDRGIAALVGEEPVAIFRLHGTSDSGDDWFAVSHIDPASGAPVMARGLVGSHADDLDLPTIASPLDKRRYDLRTGNCLDDPALSLATYKLLVADGWVLVA